MKLYSFTNKNTKYLDIVHDVLCYVPLHWAASDLVQEL